MNDSHFVSDKGAVVKTSANAEKTDEEEKGNAALVIHEGLQSKRMNCYFYTLLSFTLTGGIVLIKV